MFEIEVREVPELLVVAEQQHLTQAQLAGSLPGAMERVAAIAQRCGGVATSSQPWLGRHGRPPEPVFIVIYEGDPVVGPVPVETCAPIDPGRPEPEGVRARRLPAHREAYVRLTKGQTEPASTISEAYVAVETWVREQGLQVTAAPREVYFTDFLAAAPEEAVFDVAFPVS